jgi:hypothetical protein
MGDRDEAFRCARKPIELVPESSDAWVGPDYRSALAFVHAWAGDTDRAIEEYAHLLRNPPTAPLDQVNVHLMRRSLQYFPLQGDPRFEALLNDPKNYAPLF